MAVAQQGAIKGKVDFDAVKCVTHEFRLSFPQLHEAASFKGSEAKFSCEMLFPKNVDLGKPAANQKNSLKQAALNAAIAMWGVDKTKWPEGLKLPWRDGDKKPERAGYAGHYHVRASSKKQPGMVDQGKRPILNVQGDLYAGCYCRAEVIAFAYDTAGNKGIGFALQNIQKLRDGEKFGGRKDAADVFDSVEDTSEQASSYSAEAGMGF